MAGDLADAGVAVVSGLALGVDGAAQAGALDRGGAPVIGVVGSGLDVVYPRQHSALWRSIADAGLLVGEAPPGASPERWRFPARNRIIAAIADAVVVIESHARGGSLSTVDAALARDRTILAVPGSIRSPASDGTNDLLAQGAAPARDAGDVLVALGLVPLPAQRLAAVRPRHRRPGRAAGLVVAGGRARHDRARRDACWRTHRGGRGGTRTAAGSGCGARRGELVVAGNPPTSPAERPAGVYDSRGCR